MSLKVRWTRSIWKSPLYILGRNAPKFWFTLWETPEKQECMKQLLDFTYLLPSHWSRGQSCLSGAHLGTFCIPTRPHFSLPFLHWRLSAFPNLQPHPLCSIWIVIKAEWWHLGLYKIRQRRGDQGEQGQQCRSSAAISRAEEWAQVNCPSLLLCWNIAKGMLIVHTLSMAFLGYSDTTLYR